MDSGLRVLITNITLSGRTGTETYVRDLAIGLLRRGHTPVVYTTDPGEIAREIQRTGVSLVDDLEMLATPPQVIHGHHHPETMTALLRFPGVPAVFVCHDRLAWHDAPPRFPRILRYVAVDENCRDRLIYEHAIPEARVRVLLNAVDLERFRPRGALPSRPQRALVFSNRARDSPALAAVRQACAVAGLELDVAGEGVGASCAEPEAILSRYDVVFAKARCALEAMAVGAAVVLCDEGRFGPMVTSAELVRLRRLNFGMRTLRWPVDADGLLRELGRYDSGDATEVSRRVRDCASLSSSLDTLIALYEEVVAEQLGQEPADAVEHRAAAAYLRRLVPFPELRRLQAQLHEGNARYRLLEAECERLRGELRRAQRPVEQDAGHVAGAGIDNRRNLVKRD